MALRVSNGHLLILQFVSAGIDTMSGSCDLVIPRADAAGSRLGRVSRAAAFRVRAPWVSLGGGRTMPKLRDMLMTWVERGRALF
jgi:hypothetical protein